MDEDIPIAIATADYVVPVQSLPQGLAKGRSSRVMMPTLPSHQLGHFEKHSLKAQGYTNGLIESLMTNSQSFPLRIWVVDNSGSMSMGDGHRFVNTKKKDVVKLVKCSRWSELKQTVEYHSQIAGLIKAPTVFRLLNDPGRMVGPQQFSIAEGSPDLTDKEIQIALKTIGQTSPAGCTPLADHIVEIRENVMAMLPQLSASGQKVAIILATDGLPTNPFGLCNSSTRANFENQLRSLVGLPVWVVIRLCTDEESVVKYYNNLDSQLELSLEVLDDWSGEAQEVYEHNPWLTYGLCLHRMREMGFHHRLFDLLDERALTLDELQEFIFLLLGAAELDGMPDPIVEFKKFVERVSIAVHKEEKQWNPVTNKMSYWINMKKLNQIYGESCSIM